MGLCEGKLSRLRGLEGGATEDEFVIQAERMALEALVTEAVPCAAQASLAHPALAFGRRECELRGAEERQPVVSFEEVDHEGSGGEGFSAPAARRMPSTPVSRFVARECFGGSGAAESGVRPVGGVVAQGPVDVGVTLGMGAE